MKSLRSVFRVSSMIGLAGICSPGCAGDDPNNKNSAAQVGGSTSVVGTKATGANPGGGGGNATVGGAGPMGGTASSTTTSAGQLAAGWLYTSGNKIYVSNGNGSGTPWMGRGVNVDDLFLCGYNAGFGLSNPEQTFMTMIDGLMTDWKPNFLRVSLSMQSYDTVSWLSNAAQYKTPMTNIINGIGEYPNTYVLVSLRSDSTMSYVTANDDATFYPTSATDPTYVALVDSFANSKSVMFGIANEPGGNSLSNAEITSAMSHAVETIRAEEDRLGVPHHIISVQGNSWTSDIGFYAKKPLMYDNIVYEFHGYPPLSSDYTYSNIPVIFGEYGPDWNTLDTSFFTAFAADLESKQLSSLAWDFAPFSNCTPDLLTVTGSATNLKPNAWGTLVQAYLLAHAQ